MLGLIVREPISAFTHFLWMVLAIPAAYPLWRKAGSDPIKRIGALVYSLTLLVCFAGSGLYHAVPERWVPPFHTIDHIGIYLLIAGTVTPIGLVVLDGWWRVSLVGGIWFLAATGIVLRLTVSPSLDILTGFYLFMGWAGCLTCCELARRLSLTRLGGLVLGGVFYTLGAIINALHWPVLIPGVLGSHELFHLFVMAGSASHYWFVLFVVLPYARSVPLHEAGVLGETRTAFGGRGQVLGKA